MSNVHGWTALAGAVVALAGGATTAQAAPKARAKSQPALAVGTSRAGSWRLEGRVLTVRLRDPLASGARTPRARVVARCGDGVIETAETTPEGPRGRELFASYGEGRAVLPRRTRQLRLRLSRDVSAAATYCVVAVTQPHAIVPERAAWMRLRRGAAPRCAPTASEQVVFDVSGTRVFSRPLSEGAFQDAVALRACRAAGGRSVGLAESWAEENAAGSVRSNDGFVGAGRWLAWVSAEHSREPSASNRSEIVIRDLGVAGDPAATVRVGTGEKLWAIGAAGAAVWSDRVVTRYDGAGNPLFSTTLTASRADGGLIELDRVAPGRTFASVGLDADGRTLRWVVDGVERSAPLPEAPAVAEGADDAGTAFRLVGRALTVRLSRPLLTRDYRRQPLVTVVCGDDAGLADGNHDIGSLGYNFAAKARAAVRVDPRTTLVRARLDGDVARRATRCAAKWNTPVGGDLVSAHMSLTSGTPFRCQVEGADRVVLETDRMLVTNAWNSGPQSGSYVYRGCVKPAGSWMTIERGSWNKYFTGSGPQLVVGSGTWLAWLYGPESGSGCTLWRRDLAATDPAPRMIEISPGLTGNVACPRVREGVSVPPEQRDPPGQPRLAIAADGTLAWRYIHLSDVSTEVWGQINVASPGGPATTVARADPSQLSLPRLSDDGRTVSWTQSDGPRSASVPAP